MSRTTKVWKKNVFKGPPPSDCGLDAEDCYFASPLIFSVAGELLMKNIRAMPSGRSVYLDPRRSGSGESP